MGTNPAELCRCNFIQTFPHLPPVIMEYDMGDLFTILNTVQNAADVASFPARRADAALRGKLRGIGHSIFIEACGMAPSKAVGSLGSGVGLVGTSDVRMNPTGTIGILSGSHGCGPGHETPYDRSFRIGLIFRLKPSRSCGVMPIKFSTAWAPMALVWVRLEGRLWSRRRVRSRPRSKDCRVCFRGV